MSARGARPRRLSCRRSTVKGSVQGAQCRSGAAARSQAELTAATLVLSAAHCEDFGEGCMEQDQSGRSQRSRVGKTIRSRAIEPLRAAMRNRPSRPLPPSAFPSPALPSPHCHAYHREAASRCRAPTAPGPWNPGHPPTDRLRTRRARTTSVVVVGSSPQDPGHPPPSVAGPSAHTTSPHLKNTLFILDASHFGKGSIVALYGIIEVHHALSGALRMLSSAHAPDAAGIVQSSAFQLPTRIVRLWWTEPSLRIRLCALCQRHRRRGAANMCEPP